MHYIYSCNASFSKASTTQAAAKKADGTEVTAAAKTAADTDKGRGAGTANEIVSVVHIRDYTPTIKLHETLLK